MKQIAVIGDGGWGTALALVLAKNGQRVRLWGPFPEYLDEIRRTGENKKFLPGVKLPTELEWVADRAAAVAGADVVVLAVPSKFFRATLAPFGALLPREALVVSVTKGLDREMGRRMTQVAREILRHAPIAALSGPSHAEEVARGIPTAVTIACTDHERAVAFGDNTKAALMTRGLAEMTRLGGALGAHLATFAGLSGLGDLIVTCTSRHSRNRMVGERLGRGESIQQILDSMAQVAEGVWTCATALDVARKHGLRAPITEEVCAVINEGKDPRAAVQALLTRELRTEQD
ncbi:MAG: NAD(P)-dependent glycerol-3-phosphate dehydrogenase [Kiritimatiellaeota bacterium]|nr:NAD(P)-dependent glycerol-3-phosphate dehydrogenase [Kiritimatiellota bacterium]